MNLVVVCGMVMHSMVIISMIKIRYKKHDFPLVLFCCFCFVVLLLIFALDAQLLTIGAIYCRV